MERNYHIETMIEERDVRDKIIELADKISKDYKDQEVMLVGTLKGSVIFMGYLLSQIDNPYLTIDFIKASSYGDATSSSGNVKILKDLDESIEGKNVVIVEDIVDTGHTISYLYKLLKDRKPKSLKICTLLDKPSRRVTEVKPDYVGFTIDDYFVVGFGLDYAEYHRNLPYIGKVVFDNEIEE